MGTKQKKSKDADQAPRDISGSSASTPDKMGVHMAETAWRVAVPFFIFSLGGIWLDNIFDTLPLFSVVGVFVALGVISYIVLKYVKEHFPETFNGGDK